MAFCINSGFVVDLIVASIGINWRCNSTTSFSAALGPGSRDRGALKGAMIHAVLGGLPRAWLTAQALLALLLNHLLFTGW